TKDTRTTTRTNTSARANNSSRANRGKRTNGDVVDYELERVKKKALQIMEEEGKLPGRPRLMDETGCRENVARRALNELRNQRTDVGCQVRTARQNRHKHDEGSNGSSGMDGAADAGGHVEGLIRFRIEQNYRLNRTKCPIQCDKMSDSIGQNYA